MKTGHREGLRWGHHMGAGRLRGERAGSTAWSGGTWGRTGGIRSGRREMGAVWFKVRNPGTSGKWKSPRELVPLKRNKAEGARHSACLPGPAARLRSAPWRARARRRQLLARPELDPLVPEKRGQRRGNLASRVSGGSCGFPSAELHFHPGHDEAAPGPRGCGHRPEPPSSVCWQPHCPRSLCGWALDRWFLQIRPLRPLV